MLAGLAPARRRLIVAVLAVVVAAVAAAAVALVVGRTDEPPTAAVPQGDPGPVLLVPGYGGSTASLEVLAGRLRDAGRDATVVPLPDDGTGDLTAAAETLSDAAEAVLERTGGPSVDVVGYSAGGVIARIWIADDGADLVRRVVTLGSPHHGTTLADLAVVAAPGECPEACRQLTTDSDLLRMLNDGDETPTGPTWVSIWTEDDDTVTPPDSARLDGAVALPVQSVCADAEVAHGELPRDVLVQSMVLAELAAGDPVPLGPDDCDRLSS